MDGIWNRYNLKSTCWGVNIAPASQGHPLAVPVSTSASAASIMFNFTIIILKLIFY